MYLLAEGQVKDNFRCEELKTVAAVPRQATLDDVINAA
jgi:hypothetical protein